MNVLDSALINELLLVLTLSIWPSLSASPLDTYYKDREDLIKNSREHAIGANLALTPEELKVNEILMHYKTKEFDKGFRFPTRFLAAQHFFNSRDSIRNSCVYRIIKNLPKGTSLHSHDTAMVSDAYVFSNFTFRDDLYVLEDRENGAISLRFLKEHPGDPWVPISELRTLDPNFNDRLKEKLTLVRRNPDSVYPDVNSVWSAFQKLFGVLGPLVTYKPVFKDYFYQALKELYEDNVKYVEFRGVLPELYDLQGDVYGPVAVVDLYYQTLQEFQKHYPDFWGGRFIYAPPRNVNSSTMDQYVRTFRILKNLHPDFIAGFDLVGQEDLGKPLKHFIPQLLELRNETKVFFHAGETLWNGQSTDLNLFDAILLNTTRIGHGYAILKHPELLKIVKERKIAVEISPISNQVLGLVRDLRNHPGNHLIANGYPVVITCDDPSFWGAKALSFDWYLAFMAMSSKSGDLRLLKQLAMNSILYSAMEDDEKMAAMEKWKNDWEHFVDGFLSGQFSCSFRHHNYNKGSI